MNDDDSDWHEALAGRPRAGSGAGTQREAALLRTALRRWPEAAIAAGESNEHALIERARAEGLFGKRSGWCAGCAERWRRWLERVRQRSLPPLI